jgi:ubiquinol-cytochrome c reductase iron-sulfur subunit
VYASFRGPFSPRPARFSESYDELERGPADMAEAEAHGGETRRDFIYLLGSAVGVVGAAAFVWPLIDSLSPAADTLAAATTEVDLAPIKPGQRVTVKWRGSPVFIDNRTPETIARAAKDDEAKMPDPQPDAARHQEGKAQWLIMVGVCTHLGCIPLGQNSGDSRGDFGGWFCPCHGSHYDVSGRIRKGPAPKNLPVPDYRFVSDTRIVIGEKPRKATA